MLKTRTKVPPHLSVLISRWQSNDGPGDLGVARFIFDLCYLSKKKGYPPLIRDFKPQYGIAPWASEALAEYFVYYPGMSKEDRTFVYATFREGSKTFWFSFVLPLYEVLMSIYGIYYKGNMMPKVDYHVIKCKNRDEAQKRLMSISSFLNKPIIHDLFGNLKPTFQEQKKKDAKDTNALLILSNGCILHASGIDQPIRGANIYQVRPKSIIFDDPQNRENVKTIDRREECDKEVMEESFGALSDSGSLIYIGNKVHDDDTLGKLLDHKNTAWKKQFHTLTYAIDENGKKIPGIGDLNSELPSWPARHTIEKIRKLRAWFVVQPRLGGVRGYLKEYYNIIKSNVDYQIKFHEAEYHRAYGENWLVFTEPDGKKEYKHCAICISNDPAISEKKLSSDAVVSVVAKLANGERYLLDYVKGKFDIHDRFIDNEKTVLLATKPEELANIRRYGSVEWIARYAMKYHPDMIVIETFGQQGTFYNETKQLLEDLQMNYLRLMPSAYKKDNKVESIRQLPLIFFETGTYYLKESMKALISEINAFPDTRLDTLDSLFLAEQFLVTEQVSDIVYTPLGIQKEHKYEKPIKQSELGLADYESWVVY